MSIFQIEVRDRAPLAAGNEQLVRELRDAGLPGLEAIGVSRLFILEGDLIRSEAERVACDLLVDPVTEAAVVIGVGEPLHAEARNTVTLEVHPRPGVMDPVAESTLAELRAENLPVESVRTGRRYALYGRVDQAAALATAGRVLANDCIEQIVIGSAGLNAAPRPPVYTFSLRHVPIRELDDRALERLSREAHLFLSLPEMRTIQRHYETLGREPTDLEVETLAQTWSEHCVHKTLRSAVVYRGAPLPPTDEAPAPGPQPDVRRFRNLLKDTIARATEELVAAGRGPQCLSVFQDNAGVIAFDERFGLAFKVETHNHPSAIEPYGGAATGIGGVIRDVIGCGLGAKPIANTDVFCVAPSDWPYDRLPQGVLHPGRVLRGVVRGVADYGNRMGIPTVNGAVYFDPRYLGNVLVYAGCLGLIPRDKINKAARPGDHILLIGGRTGRDGIHGATFSSAELTDTHADEFSHAVQIGNAITEKRFLDAVLQARDAAEGCLYTAITDCGAGGLSSAVGEMAAEIGAEVDLDRVPLKYAGLKYDEIWISEAQERMVLAVPPEHLARILALMRAEEVEATVIGTFGHTGPRGAASLVLRFAGHVVGELDMEFLHHGLPRLEREAAWEHPLGAP
ncbi:MAG: phosphoribosylformylglycinamidine synthase subunit PurS, partial [Planctomycetota bacterium]